MNSTQIQAATPLPDENQMVRAMGHTLRWRMLKELGRGEIRTIGELAAAAGCNYDNAIRHLTILKKAGLVVQERGKLYQIPKRYLPAPGQPVVDYGHCLLRLDKAG
jgi:DNA-binding transcriptional ArsR family regulator